jgi:hypothetical protein
VPQNQSTHRAYASLIQYLIKIWPLASKVPLYLYRRFDNFLVFLVHAQPPPNLTSPPYTHTQAGVQYLRTAYFVQAQWNVAPSGLAPWTHALPGNAGGTEPSECAARA